MAACLMRGGNDLAVCSKALIVHLCDGFQSTACPSGSSPPRCPWSPGPPPTSPSPMLFLSCKEAKDLERQHVWASPPAKVSAEGFPQSAPRSDTLRNEPLHPFLLMRPRERPAVESCLPLTQRPRVGLSNPQGAFTRLCSG